MAGSSLLLQQQTLPSRCPPSIKGGRQQLHVRKAASVRDRMVSHFRATSAPEQEANSPPQQAEPSPQQQLQHIEDPWVARTLENTLTSEPSTSNRSLEELRATSLGALRSLRMPSQRNEAYRFCDVSPILKSHLKVAGRTHLPDSSVLSQNELGEEPCLRYVLVDGRLERDLSSPLHSSDGVYIGPLDQAPPEAAAELGSQSHTRGSPFALVNGASAQGALCIVVQPGVQAPQGIHVLYFSSGGTPDQPHYSAPRALVCLHQGASLTLTEEFCALPGQPGSHFSNSILEASLAPQSSLSHRYVQLEGEQGWHMKGTLVRQGEGSSYSLTEACIGASIARHDVSVAQAGPATTTAMHAFVLSGREQLHDLHTRLTLEHPDGSAEQLHKCIVAAGTGRGVFDGNVQVKRLAQRTDAKQLSRNLLLAPRATVNVKPNLQIVADDVACSHGCTVSDLEEEQMFYFRARGISAEAARQILVFSFGAEVTQRLQSQPLIARVERRVASMLAPLIGSVVPVDGPVGGEQTSLAEEAVAAQA